MGRIKIFALRFNFQEMQATLWGFTVVLHFQPKIATTTIPVAIVLPGLKDQVGGLTTV